VAQTELVRWLEAEFGLAMLDAYQLVSQAVESPLANVVDTNYTSVAKIAKQYLPRIPAMRGTHDRLVETARRYRG
jgi:acetamidase/formamidase